MYTFKNFLNDFVKISTLGNYDTSWPVNTQTTGDPTITQLYSATISQIKSELSHQTSDTHTLLALNSQNYGDMDTIALQKQITQQQHMSLAIALKKSLGL